MLNKKLKLLIILLLSFVIVFAFSMVKATEDEVTLTSSSEEAETSEEVESEPEYEEFEGDLYVYQSNVTMDKLVDGNAYIMGNNVKITGQVNGNLFVLANDVSLDGAYIRYTAYICAKKVYYNGYANDLYCCANKIEMTYDSYVIRDAKISAKDAIIKTAIGRDLDLSTRKVDFGNIAKPENDSEESSEVLEDVPIIYGNLNYSANKSFDFRDGIVEGEIKYNKGSNGILSTILTCVALAASSIVVYILLNKFAPDFVNKISEFGLKKSLISLGIGVLSFIAVIIVSAILFVILIGNSLALIVIALFSLLCLLSIPVATIYAVKKILPLLKLENKMLANICGIVVISIALILLYLIPYAGMIIKLLVKAFGIGLIILSIFKK